MKRTTLRKTSGLAAVALSLSMGLAACSSEEEPADTASEDTTSEETPAEEPSEDAGEMDPAAQVFGPACSAVPQDGEGSLTGMVDDPVATAASNNPLLSTLVTAVQAADLVETLNTAPALTVFAPYNDAFAAIPEADLNALLEDKEALTNVLGHHVLGEQVAPENLSGEFETFVGTTLTVNGEGEAATIGDEEAAILCGNIPTANATVYVIDTVLMP
ncbi:fasciclin domain-containing protein [Nocardioides perillae]|uniref:Putative surface protein with fasciclin (FAS1) repeats n=1 Tax=Nocardioides perillae TaxID=1119534 RepID=A0A7Y9RSE8_9ACTN|nr:fasciclin domain-containing protein [Nocardioides perillae]NYG54033.1 putative surface protein with fasciclin (FAS1) repeats [Nocardioides perillae]